jgi:hypothetical protein
MDEVADVTDTRNEVSDKDTNDTVVEGGMKFAKVCFACIKRNHIVLEYW